MQATLHSEEKEASANITQASPGLNAATISSVSHIDSSLLTQLWRSCAGWVLVAFVLIIQWGLFYQFAQREVVWAYPTNHDQNVYLTMSYETYEQILEKGLIPGLLDGLSRQIANGVMIHIQASLLFLIIGPSRMSALTLNFVYFALFQCILVWTLRWLSERWNLALIGLGLLLTAMTPFFYAGGLMDFRIDFIAFCLFGILICLIIRSEIFASWRWSMIVGAVAALAVLFRFITMVYLLGIFGLIFVFFSVRLWRHRQNQSARRFALQQLYGLMIAGSILLIFTIPALWHNRQAIQDYYVVGHLTGSENKIRAQAAGVFNTLDSILFYPRSVIYDHAGSIFLGLSAFVLIMALVFWRLRSGQEQQVQPRRSLDLPSTYFSIAACLLVPYSVLTLNVAKSPVVGNILVLPLIWLVLLTIALLSGATRANAAHPVVRNGMAVLTAIALCAGVYTQFNMLSRRGGLSQRRADVEQILQLHDLIFQYSQQFGWDHPLISVDRNTDYFDATIMRTVMYERHGVLFDGRKGLGSSIFAVTQDDAIDIAKKSDFVVISIPHKPEQFIYPFDISMQTIRSSLIAACDANLVPVRHFNIFDHDVVVYIRPDLKMTAESDGWIANNGLTLTGPSSILRVRPTIELSGKTSFEYLAKVPDINARLLMPDQTSKSIPATFERLKSSGQDYRITLSLNPKDMPADTTVNIRVTFDTYFVPKDRGVGEDTRQLVIRTPDHIKLLLEQ